MCPIPTGNREANMTNVSPIHRSTPVAAPALPSFVTRRVERFHTQRVAVDWGVDAAAGPERTEAARPAA